MMIYSLTHKEIFKRLKRKFGTVWFSGKSLRQRTKATDWLLPDDATYTLKEIRDYHEALRKDNQIKEIINEV